MRKAVIFIVIAMVLLIFSGCSEDTSGNSGDYGDDSSVNDSSLYSEDDYSDEPMNNEDEVSGNEESDANSKSQPQVDFLSNWQIPADYSSMSKYFKSIDFTWMKANIPKETKLDLSDPAKIGVTYVSEEMLTQSEIKFDGRWKPVSAKIGLSFDGSVIKDSDYTEYKDPNDVEGFIIQDKLADIFYPFQSLNNSDEYVDEVLMGNGDYGIKVSQGKGPVKESIGQTQVDMYYVVLDYSDGQKRELKFADFGDFQMLVGEKITASNAAFQNEDGTAFKFEVVEVKLK